ncbi:MAG: hypothetical protein ACXVLQ_03720 [Bacteriovorax sp.]
MRKSLFLIAGFLLLSCAKEEFSANKANQSNAINALTNSCGTLYAQSTLVSPKVDVLLLWDNSSSALFINSATKNSFNQLINNVSENFDYHILSAPLISTNSNTLNEASLVVKDSTSVNGVSSILRTKDQASASLSFTLASGSYEPGVDRATSIIQANRSNGIFRSDAYTIIVVMSNGDDTSCEIATGYNSCAKSDWEPLLQPKIEKLLCLRGNASGINCSGVSPLNSSMMRFINIAPLTSCSSGMGKINTRYRKVAKTLYEAPYTNGWPTSNDNLNPFISGGVPYPDNYDICSIDFNHIFDGVNSAIKQSLIKHVYNFWPIAGTNDSVDPETLIVTRIPDGKVLINRTGQSNPSDGYGYIGNQSDHSTRIFPTAGENFTGKMIQLFGSDGSDLVQFPQALRVCYKDFKAQYGYIYLKNGKPDVASIEVYFNGTKIPHSSTDGWDYMGLTFTSSLDSNYKIVDLPPSGDSGYFLKLNGSYRFKNDSTTNVSVYYISAP